MKTRTLIHAVAAMVLVVSNLLAAPPGNDNFTSATILTGASGNISGTNVEATLESGESDYGQRSVWYSWTAPSNGVVAFDTLESDFDTKLSLTTGSTVATLSNLATNDDYDDGTGSLVQANVTSGTTYYIGVLGYDNGSVGIFNLNWTLASPPANDNFADGTIISGESGNAPVSLALATREINDNWGYSRSVWYRWTAPATGKYVFDTRGADRATELNLFTGSSITNLSTVSVTASYSEISEHLIKLEAVAGSVYHIHVSTNSSLAVSFDLKWRQVITPANDAFHAAIAITGAEGTLSASTFEAGVQTYEPDWRGDAHSIWYSWTAPLTGVVAFDTFGSATVTTLMVTNGTALDSLNIIADNQLSELDLDGLSRVVIPVVNGNTYRIRVASFEEGDIKLNWSQVSGFTPDVINLGSASFEAVEGGPAVNISMSRNPGSAGTATRCYLYTEAGSADEDDFVSSYTTVDFASAATTASITIPIKQDRRFEGEETFLVRLILPNEGTAFGLSVATVNIADDEPFIPLKANYVGLAQVFPFDPALTGILKINATGNGSFSGSLQLGTAAADPFSGSFNAAGKSTLSVKRKSGGNALVSLTYADNGNRIRATVTAVGKTTTIQAWRIIYGKDVEISPKPLLYTAVIKSPLSATGDVPKANSFLSISVSVNGVVMVVGSLSDDTSFTASGPIAGYDIFPLYASLYKGKGCVCSELFIQDGELSVDDESDDETPLTWFKTAIPTDKVFKTGFTQTTAVEIYPYTFSKKVPFIRNVRGSQGAADFIAKGPGTPLAGLSQVFRLLENNSIALPLSPQVKLTLKFVPASGFFSGTFQQGTAKAVPFKGAVLQKEYFDEGYFDYEDEALGYFLAPETGSSVVGAGTIEIKAAD